MIIGRLRNVLVELQGGTSISTVYGFQPGLKIHVPTSVSLWNIEKNKKRRGKRVYFEAFRF